MLFKAVLISIFSRHQVLVLSCTQKQFISDYMGVSLFLDKIFSIQTYKKKKQNPVSILRKSISGRHRPVRVADGPMTARCRFT